MTLRLPQLGDGLGLLGIALGLVALLVAGFLMLATLTLGTVAALFATAPVSYGGLNASGWIMAAVLIAAISLSAYAITAALRYLGGEDRSSLGWAWGANIVLILGGGFGMDAIDFLQRQGWL